MINKKIIPLVSLMISASLVGCGSGSNNNTTNTGSSSGASSTGGSSTGGSSTGGSSTGGSSTGGSSTGGSSTGGSSTGGSSTGGSSTGGSSTGGSSTGGSSTGGSSTGGSSTGGSSTGGMTGTGNCVNLTRPMAGLKYNVRAETFGQASGVVEVETTFVSFTNTATETNSTSTVNATVSGVSTDTTTNSNTKQTHTIETDVDGTFTRTTKIVIDLSVAATIEAPVVGPITTNTMQTITNDIDPFVRSPIDEACENQTWTDTYVDKVTSDSPLPGGAPSVVSNTITRVNTVEAINVSKTVPGGTFNTIQLKIEDGDTVTTNWLDIASGAPVASEVRNNTNTLLVSSEIISKSP